jgi:photosystem II stability/assembly factor-like uncharacterized protein
MATACSSHSQWVQTTGPGVGYLATLAQVDSLLFAGSEWGGGIFRSADGGRTWQPANEGVAGLGNGTVRSFVWNGTILFASSPDGGIIGSSDKGDSWQSLNAGLPTQNVRALTISQGGLFAATSDSGVIRSTDNGGNWITVNEGLPVKYVDAIAASGRGLVVGTNSGVYRSTDDGSSWQLVDSEAYVWRFAVSDSIIVGGTQLGAILRSTDYGKTWKRRDSICTSGVNAVVIFKKRIIASGFGSRGLRVSSDFGESWNTLANEPPGTSVTCLLQSGDDLIAGTYGGPIFRSTDDGLSWNVSSLGPANSRVEALGGSEGGLIAGLCDGGVYRSTDAGSSWIHLSSAVGLNEARGIVVKGDTIFVGTFRDGVFRSTDDGASWHSVNTGLPTDCVLAMQSIGSDIFVGVYSTPFYPGALFRGVGGGSSWMSVGADFATYPVSGLLAIEDTLYAGTGSGIFRSTNHGTNWNRITETPAGRLAATSSTELFATSSTSVYRYTKTGIAWTALKTLSGPYYILSLATVGSAVFAGTDREGIFLSEDHGMTWIKVMTPPFKNQVSSMFVGAKHLYAGTYYAGVWRRPIGEMITSTAVPKRPNPNQFSLSQNYPNPFNPTTIISYEVASTSHVKLAVYDLLGREVASLVNQVKPPGSYDVRFEATDLSTGIYFYRLESGTYGQTKKLVLLR